MVTLPALYHRAVRYSLATLIALLATAYTLSGQNVQIEVPATVIQGKPFQLVYTIQGEAEVNRFDNPQLKGLSILYGPARQTMSSFHSVNGHSTASSATSLTYTLLAEQVGTYSIAPTTAIIGGRRVQVKGANVRVLPSRGGAAESSAKGLGRYLYRAIPGVTTVYEQQAIPVQYKLYSTTEFEISSFKAPEYDGFISASEAEDDGRRQLVLENYQGTNYRTVVIREDVLFPQRAGSLALPASEIGIRIPLHGDSEDPFFGSTTIVDKTLRSTPVPIEVRPLPSEGKPSDFSGAVGAFRMKAELLTKTPKTNESVTLRFTLEGTGNLKLAKAPKLQFPETFEVYDPKESYEQSISSNNVRGKKVIEYFAIPRRVGKVTIPSVAFSFFNPQTRRYETLHSPAFTLDVKQGKASSALSGEGSDGAVVHQQGMLPPRGELGEQDIPLFSLVKGLGYPTLYLILFALACGAYTLLARSRRLRADSLSYNASRANSVATKRLRLAHKLMQEGSREPFYEELMRALWGYLGDKLRLPVSELSRASVSQILAGRGLGQTLIGELTSVIDEAEFARFAPVREGDMQQLYERTAGVIGQIDSHELHK